MRHFLKCALIAVPMIASALLLSAGVAYADIVVSQLIVELQPGHHAREDMEVWNKSPERAYVAVEPSEILNAGLPTETRVREHDPAKLGLLVSPTRMILEPGERRIVRVALISPQRDRERVYRITVKPVAGQLSSDRSGLKILVGYDALVLARPPQALPNVHASRAGDELTFRNAGNVSVELVAGQQCDLTGKKCIKLPGKRLYAGAVWRQRLKSSEAADYTIQVVNQSVRKHFDAAPNATEIAWSPSPAIAGQR